MKMNKLSKGHNLRWESSRMMLPEHREQLLEQKRKQQEFIPPLLDDDQLQEMNRVMVTSIEQKQTVTVTYAEKYGPVECSGWIQKVNPLEGWLTMANSEEIKRLSFTHILKVELS